MSARRYLTSNREADETTKICIREHANQAKLHSEEEINRPEKCHISGQFEKKSGEGTLRRANIECCSLEAASSPAKAERIVIAINRFAKAKKLLLP